MIANEDSLWLDPATISKFCHYTQSTHLHLPSLAFLPFVFLFFIFFYFSSSVGGHD